jgi:hypothetical protein
MIALLLAAQLTAAAPPLLQNRLFRQAPPSEFCKSNGKVETSAPADPALLYRQDGKPLAHRLAQLPKPNKEKAVLRSVDGCANPLVVQFNVGP